MPKTCHVVRSMQKEVAATRCVRSAGRCERIGRRSQAVVWLHFIYRLTRWKDDCLGFGMELTRIHYGSCLH